MYKMIYILYTLFYLLNLIKLNPITELLFNNYKTTPTTKTIILLNNKRIWRHNESEWPCIQQTLQGCSAKLEQSLHLGYKEHGILHLDH